MYLRPAFTETDPDRIIGLIEAHPFGLLVTTLGGVAEASHIPFTVVRDAEGFTLFGHLAKANPQCEAIAGGAALAIFSGPHAYIAPGWYETQPAVPTWDYAAVHVTGTLAPVQEDGEVSEMLTDMSRHDPAGFDVHGLPEKYRAAMYQGIRGFSLRAVGVQAQWKMSQNRSVADRLAVMAALRAQGQGDVAALIGQTLPPQG